MSTLLLGGTTISSPASKTRLREQPVVIASHDITKMKKIYLAKILPFL
jgi:hypothetical protein